MLDYSDNPAQTLIGLSANVLSVLCGGILGMAVTSIGLPSEIAVIALTVVCVTLVMLPR